MTSNLQARVESRKRELISEIVEHKKNSSRYGAAEEVNKLKDRLAELAHLIKEGVADWANVGPGVKVKLDAWLAK